MPKVFRSSFTFGGLMAESDPLLTESYLDNGDYEAISSSRDPHCFIIGRTGSGKSASFQFLEEEYPQKVIRIIPENLSLPYITNLGVIRHLLNRGVRLEPFLRALWKHVMIIEILRHRYQITSPERKQTIISSLVERFRRDQNKVKAIRYLEEFGDNFWCDADERIRKSMETFVSKVTASGGLDTTVHGVGLRASGSVEKEHSQEVEREIAAHYQRIVNDTQIPRLNEMISLLDQEILDAQHLTFMVIDDLDRVWEDESLANLLIRCLFSAVVDMQRIEHLKILVALRTNIFEQLHYGEQGRSSQEEKYRGLALHLRWTENDLRSLLQQRAEVASKRYNLDPPKALAEMLPKANKEAGDPLAYLLSRTMLRPRDAILFMNACIREAAGRDRITWDHIRRAEKIYSDERLLALRDEWKDPYFDIDKAFECFRSKPYRMTQHELTTVLDNIAELLADPKFLGTIWLTKLSETIWAPGSSQLTWFEWYGPLVNLFYHISFLGIAKGPQGTASYSYHALERALEASDIPANAYFEIHPAFRRALNVDERPIGTHQSTQKASQTAGTPGELVHARMTP
ncbi:MAG TPA: hypothetical protein VFV38_39295 [Ktedonobacteraceae bacterium]|nr:hypothetical protein [Ktedonobacteraceae bacterium]